GDARGRHRKDGLPHPGHSLRSEEEERGGRERRGRRSQGRRVRMGPVLVRLDRPKAAGRDPTGPYPPPMSVFGGTGSRPSGTSGSWYLIRQLATKTGPLPALIRTPWLNPSSASSRVAGTGLSPFTSSRLGTGIL